MTTKTIKGVCSELIAAQEFLKRGIDYREILRISLSIMNCNSFAIT